MRKLISDILLIYMLFVDSIRSGLSDVSQFQLLLVLIALVVHLDLTHSLLVGENVIGLVFVASRFAVLNFL